MAYPEKYHRLLDRQVWEFIRETEKYYPPDAVDLCVAEQRIIYDRLCRTYHNGIPQNVSIEYAEIDAVDHRIPVRQYEPTRNDVVAQVLYLHGGGFVVGGLDSHDDVCAEICDLTRFSVTSVDYKLSPEHPFPADFNDVKTVFSNLSQNTTVPTVVVGDSAGGNLAAALCHSTRPEPLNPIGQVLIYPGLGHEYSCGSAIEHQYAPMLTTSDMEYYKKLRIDEKTEHLTNPNCSPLIDQNMRDLPRTVVFGAECDPICDDGRNYCLKLDEAGGSSQFILEHGLVHGYLRARHSCDLARDSFKRIVDAISMLGNGHWHEIK